MRTLLRAGALVRLFVILSLAPTALLAQNVLLWDNDNNSFLVEPETGGLWACQQGLQEALSDNGVTPTVVNELPEDLSSYDVIFVTLGVWDLGCGRTPPGAVGAEQQSSLIEFLEEGKALYIEGVDIGSDHSTTTFFDYLGCDYIDDDAGLIRNVNGTPECFMANRNFVYANLEEADYSVDILGADGGELFQRTQSGYGCGVYYVDPTYAYHVITSSAIFGVYTNGDGDNTREALMERYLDVLLSGSDPAIATSDDRIDFGDVFIGYPETMSISLYNSGVATLNISSIAVSNNVFSLSGSGPYTLDGGESVELEITCTPAAVETLHERITVTSNDPGGDFIISVQAACKQAPVAQASTTGVAVLLPPGGMNDDQSFTLTNTGDSQLSYVIEAESVDPPANRDDGGPDQYGYIWRDSDDPDGPEYQWNSIASTGTPVENWTATLPHYDPKDQGWSGPFDLGFTFVYYGEPYDQIYLSSDGYVGFSEQSVNTTYRSNNYIPNAVAPNNIICPFFDDLDGELGGAMYTQQVGDEFVIEWVEWPFAATSLQTLTMQLRLDKQGRITVHYLYALSSRSATIGIEDDMGWRGLEVVYDAEYRVSGKAIRFQCSPEWLTLGSTSGSLAPNQSEEIVLGFDATGLIEGDYHAMLRVTSNDPATSQIEIPLTLTVGYPEEVSATFNVSCNSNASPEGAALTLTNHDNEPSHVYSATVPASGEVSFPVVASGVYTLEIEHDLHDVYLDESLSILDDIAMSIELIETLFAPTNLQTEINGNDVLLTWDGPPTRLFVEYNVYLDGYVYIYGPHNYYQWTDLSKGTHTLGASCVYGTGESTVTATDVEIVGVNGEPAPCVTMLGDVYPNPFNPSTTVAFSLAQPGEARIEVFNLRGQRVRMLHDGALSAGAHTVEWNGRDDHSAPCASGLYFVRMACGDYRSIRKAMLLK